MRWIKRCDNVRREKMYNFTDDARCSVTEQKKVMEWRQSEIFCSFLPSTSKTTHFLFILRTNYISTQQIYTQFSHKPKRWMPKLVDRKFVDSPHTVAFDPEDFQRQFKMLAKFISLTLKSFFISLSLWLIRSLFRSVSVLILLSLSFGLLRFIYVPL